MSKDAKLLRFYSILAGLIFLTAPLAPFILTQDPYESSMQQAFLPPSAEHWFGTDKLGRDLFTRVIYGARISVFMSLTVVILIAGIGSAIGVVAGYVGGKVDTIIMRLADMFLAFPGIVLAIAIAGMMGGSVVNAILALVVVGWTKYARLARSASRADVFPPYRAQYPFHHTGDGSRRYRGDDDGAGRSFVPRLWRAAADAGMGTHAQRRQAGTADGAVAHAVPRRRHRPRRRRVQSVGRCAARLA